MELNEKLQELRKSKGMTQEELAEVLYVSRTAISKWESGRGTPSIESLKQISAFFSVSIDDLLSAEKILSLAEQEHKVSRQNQVHLWNGIIDVCSAGLIFLPLYPNAVGQTVYAVNLLSYPNRVHRSICLLLFWALILTGVVKTLLACLGRKKEQGFLTVPSIVLSILSVLFLTAARISYATAVAFLLLILKGTLLFCGPHPNSVKYSSLRF